ncbi:hypothetical protein BCR36DRAFT_71960 [Piromyces finnis]|uniref:Uncharacterized protein n=1 Tax=Piromyces finnis TaxID=1754191 RepID=A0A1Y1V6N0_9FUNG|nr:hypothetical protein BCR36DRAFT_71960 [Piromyces finnis]|eukprot:ORX48612.1 hypothetical protein BCR36DRAFT_71960 [Piromyces finnis]
MVKHGMIMIIYIVNKMFILQVVFVLEDLLLIIKNSHLLSIVHKIKSESRKEM